MSKMDRTLSYRIAFGLVFALMMNGASEASSDPLSDRYYLTLKAGGNAETAEDDINGVSLGGGFALGTLITPRWAAEFEYWQPAYIDSNGDKHRDILYGASVAYRVSLKRKWPAVLVGFAIGDVDTKSEDGKFDSREIYVQMGVGYHIPLSSSVDFTLDVRSNFAFQALIVRPAAGVIFRF